jgi:hypothetical protein
VGINMRLKRRFSPLYEQLTHLNAAGVSELRKLPEKEAFYVEHLATADLL